MIELKPAVRALLDGANFGHMATLMASGAPQVSAIWLDTDGTYLLINTADGRTKTNNVRRDPRVAISVVDQGNAYREVMIRGRVVEILSEGADEHIDALAKKYLGQDRYPFRQPGERRLILKIEPDAVSGMNLD